MQPKCSICSRSIFEDTYFLVRGNDNEILSLCNKCSEEKMDRDETALDSIDCKITHIRGEKTDYKELGKLAFQYFETLPPYTSLQRITEEMVIRGGVPGITSGAILKSAIDYFPSYVAKRLY